MEIAISGQTKLVGLLASPARHSLSPQMHQLAFQLTKTDAVYLAFEVSQAQLPDAVRAIRAFDMLGANVSMPHKQAVLHCLDAKSTEAALIGSVNTIKNEQGKLIGHNTDGLGFLKSLAAQGEDVRQKKLTILGAGGAGLAIIVQAALAGAREIVVFNRSQTVATKIQQIAKATACSIRLYCISDHAQFAQEVAESQFLINATSIGMTDGQLPIKDISVFSDRLCVCDLIYTPSETVFLKEARLRGAKTINGMGMLLYQGALAFELWTGKSMPVREVARALHLE